MQELRQSTAVTVKIGPFLDDTTGKDPETALTIAQADVRLSKNGGNMAQKNESTSCSHDELGVYDCPLDATDTNTLGRLRLDVQESGALPVWKEFMVVTQNYWDSKYGTDKLQVDVTQIADGVITAAKIGADAITADKIADAAIDNATFAADVGSTAYASNIIALAVRKVLDELNLNHLMKDAVADGDDMTAEIADGTVLSNILTQAGDTSAFIRALSTLEALGVKLGAIAVTGAAINLPAESYNLTTGTQSSGTYADTAALDGTYHEHTDVGNAMDLYYQFDVGGDGIPVSCTITGYGTGQNDAWLIQAYNWGTSTWDQVGRLPGYNGSENQVWIPNLLIGHVGTVGADIGKVRIRFVNDGALSTATLHIDQIFVSKAVVVRTAGYQNGAIWVNTNGSNTKTEDFVDGTADNPVSTWAAALALSASLGIKRFRITAGSSITLSGDSTGYTLLGSHPWTLDLNGQVVEDAHFEGADVTGTGTSGTGAVYFKDCHLDTVVLGKAHIVKSSLITKLTLSDAETYILDECYSGGGATTPEIDFGAAVGDSIVRLAGWSGGIEISNLNATGTDKFTIQGTGKVILAASCAGGTVGIHGHITLEDNVVGGFSGTLNDDGRIDVDQINAEVDTALADYGANTTTPPTVGEIRTEMEANGSKLDHLWEMTEDDAGVRRLTAHALGEAPTGGLSAQETRDAMKLAPSAGAPAAGSIDKHLDDASTHSAADVWAVGTRTLTSFGTLIADIWNRLTSALTTDGSIGKLIVDYLDAKISNIPGAISDAATITEDTLDVNGAALGKAVVSGNAVTGAVVAVYADSDTDCKTVLYDSRTDGDGGYAVQVVAGATYRVKIFTSGYASSVKRVTV